MEDRFVRGFTAGAGAGVLMNVWGYQAGKLGWTTLTMPSWAGIIVFGHAPPFGPGEYLFALLAHLGFTGVLGVAFAYLVPAVGSRHLVFKGWVFSLAIWFLIYAVTTLFRLEGTVPLPLRTALSNATASTIYGLALPALLTALTPAGERERHTAMLAAPAMKPAEEETEGE